MNLITEAVLVHDADSDVAVANGYELIDGQLMEKPMGAEASLVGANVIALLKSHVSSHKLGLVFGSECGYQIFKNQPRKVRKPDVSFIARGRLPGERPPRGNVSIPPDLAVEVVSPNDVAEEIESRVDEYLEAGTRLMWLLYPQTAAVWVVRQDGLGVRLKGEQAVTGDDVIPGFTCQVRAFFADLEPS